MTLNYRCAAFSILSTANSLLGDPMNCACADCAKSGVTKEIINTHCWITGTFTLPSKQPDTDSLGITKGNGCHREVN